MSEGIDKAAAILKNGGLAVLPTETFYALSCNALDTRAVERVFAVKKRPPGKPLPLVIGEVEQLSLLTDSITDLHRKLIDTFWPGPLTIIFQGKPGLPSGARDAQGRVAVRLSSHPDLREICRKIDLPLTASSANSAGKAPVCDIAQLEQHIAASVGIIFPETKRPGGKKPSSIIAPGLLYGSKEELLLLREGAVTKEQLEAAGFSCVGMPQISR
jgi:L-threonylcarbamoyladenylate synthase